MQEAITRRGFMWGAGMAGIAAAAVLTGCSAGSGSGQPQESNASTDVTQVTLDDAKLTADDLCAAAFQFKTLSEAGTSDEYEREYRFALAASALGNADAMLYLGEMYQGSHIEAARSSDNPVQDAVSWWNKAAESGVARGYTNIGLLYMHETVPGGGDSFGSIPYDPATAVEYYEKGAEGNDMKAFRYLGLCYQDGIGVDADAAKAEDFFRQAYEAGDSTGGMYYAEYLLDGRGGTQDVDKAISILKELVDGKKHDMVACALMLGDIYSVGVYAASDVALAKSYYQIVIDNAKEDSDEAEKAASALEALG